MYNLTMLSIRVARPIGFTASSTAVKGARRALSTLPNNPHIYVFPDPSKRPNTSLLTLLPTNPPTASLAIGTTTAIPPTPQSFTENHNFLPILQDVIRKYATSDPIVQGQAAAFASTGGSNLGSGGSQFIMPANHPSRAHIRKTKSASAPGGGAGGDGAGGASAQGGTGGGGRGGWIHVSDMRNPPDYGRIAWPEDIFGSLEVNGRGEFVTGGGNYQESGTYRIVTREGILGLSDVLRQKLVERLKELEAQVRK